jgi:predicted nucleic acid-binding protein
MIVLDTNVLSELMRPVIDAGVAAWIDDQDRSTLATTSICKAELLFGIAKLTNGKKKFALAGVAHAILDRLGNRVWPFADEDALHYAEIVVRCRQAGRPIDPLDAQIAAISRSRGAMVATRDLKHFADLGIELIDPWSD